jgi:hypothetical protein
MIVRTFQAIEKNLSKYADVFKKTDAFDEHFAFFSFLQISFSSNRFNHQLLHYLCPRVYPFIQIHPLLSNTNSTFPNTFSTTKIFVSK